MHPLIKHRRGVTMVEYALITALVAVAAVTVLSVLGGSVSRVFSRVNADVRHASPTAT